MGFSDGLAGRSFKRVPDFFPYGIWGHGFIIDLEQAYRSMRRQAGGCGVFALVLILVLLFIGRTLPRFAGPVTLAGYIVVCVVWTRFQLRGLQKSKEKFSLEESMTSQAIAFGPVLLWLFEIMGLAFMGFGILTLIVNSPNWPNRFSFISSGGLFAAFSAYMIILLRRWSSASAR